MSRRWLPYLALSVVDTVAAGRGARRIRRFTKPALMPALAVAALPGNRANARVRQGAGLALAGSAVGDVALLRHTDGAFVAGVGGFLAGHAGWLGAAAGTRGGEGFVRRHPWLVVPFGAVVAGANVLFLPKAPAPLRVPVLVYSAVLGAMALAGVDAAGRLPRARAAATSAGALLFVVSDTVLAARRFRGLGGAAHRDLADGVVMGTYTAAQGLLAYGLLADER